MPVDSISSLSCLSQPQGAPLKSSENQTQKTRSELAIAEEAGKGGGESAEEKARRREEKKGEKERRQGKQLADIGVH